MVILHFWVKNVVFEQKQFHISKLAVLYRNNTIGWRKHSLKIWAWSDHFSRFHRYWKFEIQRNKSEWCKTFFEEYIYESQPAVREDEDRVLVPSQEESTSSSPCVIMSMSRALFYIDGTLGALDSSIFVVHMITIEDCIGDSLWHKLCCEEFRQMLRVRSEGLNFKALNYAVHENLLFFPMQFIWPVNTDKTRFNTYIYIFLQQSLSWYCLLSRGLTSVWYFQTEIIKYSRKSPEYR